MTAHNARLIGVVAVLGLVTAFVPESRLHAQQEPTLAEVAELRARAEQGDVGAQFDLGNMYDNADGVPWDPAEAAVWYRLAADQGVAEAQYSLGGMYVIGRGVPQDYVEAERWFQLAADQGHSDAQADLAAIRNALAASTQLNATVAELRVRADQGEAQAQYNLGLHYAAGDGVPEEDTEAIRWYRLAADQGHADAQFSLGLAYARGYGTPQDDAEAVRWYRLAAEQGDMHAQYNLGGMYGTGQGVPQDDAEAVRWYRLAAAQGDARAQGNLAVRYETGRGVPQDDAEAVYWYRLVANLGNAGAQRRLGFMYSTGRGVPQDDAEAVRWFRLAADQGDADAQSNLGVAYAFGRGVPRDDAEALLWYRRAAEQGVATAQFNLGVIYNNGEGVPQDYSEAVRWHRLAAEQGVAEAQYALGAMYDNGRGVPQNYVEAVWWYRLAADQGHTSAQGNLGAIYANGRDSVTSTTGRIQGVSQNYVEAHMWTNLAAAQSSGEDRDLWVKNRDLVAAKMTADQIAEAQRRAREWPSPPAANEESGNPPLVGNDRAGLSERSVLSEADLQGILAGSARRRSDTQDIEERYVISEPGVWSKEKWDVRLSTPWLETFLYAAERMRKRESVTTEDLVQFARGRVNVRVAVVGIFLRSEPEFADSWTVLFRQATTEVLPTALRHVPSSSSSTVSTWSMPVGNSTMHLPLESSRETDGFVAEFDAHELASLDSDKRTELVIVRDDGEKKYRVDLRELR